MAVGTLCISPGAAFTVYPNGLVAVRCSDYIYGARGTLSTTSDALASSGTCVIDTQAATSTDYPDPSEYGYATLAEVGASRQFIPDSADAEDTIRIPLADLPLRPTWQYWVLLSTRIAGEPDQDYTRFERFDSNDPYAWPLRYWGVNGLAEGSMKDAGGLTTYYGYNSWSPTFRIPHYTLQFLVNLGGYDPDTDESLNIRAWHYGSDSAEWRIESAIFVPIQPPREFGDPLFFELWSPYRGSEVDDDQFLGPQPEALEVDEMGVVSVDEVRTRRWSTLGEIVDFQKATDETAEPTMVEEFAFSSFDDDPQPALDMIMLAGPIYIDQSVVTDDDFARSIGGAQDVLDIINSNNPIDPSLGPYVFEDWGISSKGHAWDILGGGPDYSNVYVDGSAGVFGSLGRSFILPSLGGGDPWYVSTGGLAILGKQMFPGSGGGGDFRYNPYNTLEYLSCTRCLTRMHDWDMTVRTWFDGATLQAEGDVLEVGGTTPKGHLNGPSWRCIVTRAGDGNATARLQYETDTTGVTGGSAYVMDGPIDLDDVALGTDEVWFRVRFNAYRMDAKIWADGDTEPADWMLTGHTPGIIRSGGTREWWEYPYAVPLASGWSVYEYPGARPQGSTADGRYPYVAVGLGGLPEDEPDVGPSPEPGGSGAYPYYSPSQQYDFIDCLWDDFELSYDPQGDPDDGNMKILEWDDSPVFMDPTTLPYGSQYIVHGGKQRWVGALGEHGSDVYMWSNEGAAVLQSVLMGFSRLLFFISGIVSLSHLRVAQRYGNRVTLRGHKGR